VIIGAGAYGREAFTLGKQSHGYGKEFMIKGYLDSNLDALNNYKGYPPVLGTVEEYEIQPDDVFICAIGGVKQRKKTSDQILSKGGKFVNLIHKSAYIGDFVNLGLGIFMGMDTVINNNTQVDDFVLINSRALIGHDCKVGKYCLVGVSAFVAGNVQIGEESTIHPKASIMKGICTSIPSKIERNIDLPFDSDTLTRMIQQTGIEQRRVVDDETCSTDLIISAGKELIEKENIDSQDIGVMVLVTQFADYIVPSSAHIVQKKLGLSDHAFAIQVNEGCSGYVYGLQLGYSLLAVNQTKYALVLVGDTTSRVCYKDDKSTRPLFGDAGSATLLYKDDSSTSKTVFELGGDGSKFEDIIMRDGGFRNPINEASFVPYTDEKGIYSRPMDLKLDGMNVYMFGIRVVPKLIKRFAQENNLDLNTVDYFILHQANMAMNKKIMTKLGIEKEHVLYSLKEFGNTACASIPMTITHNRSELKNKDSHVILCGFGIGMSWGVCSIPFSKDINYYQIEYF